MLFRQSNSSNVEYKRRFQEHLEIIEIYNGGILFGNSPGATAREVKVLGIDTDASKDVEKARVSERGKYLAVELLLSSDRRR